MATIWVVCLEPIDMRYTKQWYTNIPKLIKEEVKRKGDKFQWNVRTVDGIQISGKTKPGAFLDFYETNKYKASQIQAIANLFSTNQVRLGDKFLVTDFWNYTITAIRYMSDLNNIPVKVHAIAHAGAYDKSDILGIMMRGEWTPHQERAWFHACEKVYFGSEYHRKMFLDVLEIDEKYHSKAVRCGQPHELIIKECASRFENRNRKNLIIFTHRLNRDKQPGIAVQLRKMLPNYEFIYTHKKNLSKDKYYDLLSQSKLVYSCADHENLGIGMMEGTLCGCVPLVPDRLSYSEIFDDVFKYKTIWTDTFTHFLYEQYQIKMAEKIVYMMENYEMFYVHKLRDQIKVIKDDFMNGHKMVDDLVTIPEQYIQM